MARVVYQAADTASLTEQYPLRVSGRENSPHHITEIPPAGTEPTLSDLSLHHGLQDLATMIVRDLTEACEALDDPKLEYPGVDAGIEPVSDDHVALVIWASQRELNRELRPRARQPRRPAVVLSELPWHIQRAFVERRRLRYLEWGIDRDTWERGWWTFGQVPDDDWEAPWGG